MLPQILNNFSRYTVNQPTTDFSLGFLYESSLFLECWRRHQADRLEFDVMGASVRLQKLPSVSGYRWWPQPTEKRRAATWLEKQWRSPRKGRYKLGCADYCWVDAMRVQPWGWHSDFQKCLLPNRGCDCIYWASRLSSVMTEELRIKRSKHAKNRIERIE